MVKVTAKDVFKVVERLSGYPDLGARIRKEDISLWRGLYFKVACEMTTETMEDIGKLAGGRSHGTVLHWNNKFEDSFLSRPDMKASYQFVKKELEVYKGRLDVGKIDAEAEKVLERMGSVYIR